MAEYEESAKKFVKTLMSEGAAIPCDSTTEPFKKQQELPPFYDEELFKKGQAFYHKNIFAIFTYKLYGLITVLSIPSILRILIHTKQSGSTWTAYKRYMATTFHMTLWYDSDFHPGSKLWLSIKEVRHMHDSASQKGCSAGLNRISQKDMALTQFGFMGYQLTRSHFISLEHASDEEWKAFIHLWRVIGYLFGIEDRFNICRESVQETRAICNLLIDKVFIPHITRYDKDFLAMAEYLVNGLWCFAPILNYNVALCLLHAYLYNNFKCTSVKERYQKLTLWQKFMWHLTNALMYSLRWSFFRSIYNRSKYHDLWLMKHFPFLAFYRFGYKKSYVNILEKTN